MSQEGAIDFNSQVVSKDTLVSTVDDPGKYEVQLNEEADGPAPKTLPDVSFVSEIEVPRNRTQLVSRFYTLMQAWGVTQMAWEDDARISLTITAGANGIHFSDNPNNLSAVGIISGVGVGHVFANQVYTMMAFTGPLYIYSDTDSSPVSVVGITVQK
jgi:hypothetical protein